MRKGICYICNKYMSTCSDRYEWTPYVCLSMDVEPPEREIAHIECYENLDEKRKKYIIVTSRMKPNKIVRGK